MHSRQQKLLVLTAVYFTLLLVEGCGLLGPLCKCKEALPYIDYHGITAGAPDPNVLGRLDVNIQPDSVEFVAQNTPFKLNLLTAAYGCDCDEDGTEGDKFPPIAMDVFADRDYNDTLPAGASLRSIFFGVTLGDIYTNLSADFRPEPFRVPGNSYKISTQVWPKTLHEPYRFTIQWVKSNGDTLTAQTNAVAFQ